MRSNQRREDCVVRRSFFIAALVVVLAGCNWAQFAGDAGHSGYQPFESKLAPGNVATVAQSWTGATGAAIASSPAVAEGVVYVGSNDGKLYAFDATGVSGCTASTCAPLWTAATGGAITSSPAYDAGVVYVGSSNGKLYAFDAKGVTNCSGSPTTCTPLWTAATGGPVTTSPAVTNGVVYVGSNDAKVYA